jgi:hypothetical protein
MRIPLQTRLSIFEAQNEHYSNWHLFARHWQHARGLRLEWAFIRPTLATRSGAAPYNPMLATLGGYAYMLTLAFTPLALSVDNTLGGCALNSGIGNTLGGCAPH